MYKISYIYCQYKCTVSAFRLLPWWWKKMLFLFLLAGTMIRKYPSFTRTCTGQSLTVIYIWGGWLMDCRGFIWTCNHGQKCSYSYSCQGESNVKPRIIRELQESWLMDCLLLILACKRILHNVCDWWIGFFMVSSNCICWTRIEMICDLFVFFVLYPRTLLMWIKKFQII